MSLATGFLRLGFGIAGESPGDAPTWFLASILSTDTWHWCKRQNPVLIWYTPGVTLATAFCCFNVDWLLEREQRLCGQLKCPPAAPAGAILQVLLGILTLNVTVKSDYLGVHLAVELSRDTGTGTGDFPDLATSFLLHKRKSTILAGCVHFAGQQRLRESIKAPSQLWSRTDVALKSATFVGTKIRRLWIAVKDKTKGCIPALFEDSKSCIQEKWTSSFIELQISWTLQVHQW